MTVDSRYSVDFINKNDNAITSKYFNTLKEVFEYIEANYDHDAGCLSLFSVANEPFALCDCFLMREGTNLVSSMHHAVIHCSTWEELTDAVAERLSL